MLLGVGDSVTRGTHLLPGQAWPDRFTAGGGPAVFNAGIGGWCIAHEPSWDLDRLCALAETLNPDAVIVALGMNDLIRTDDSVLVYAAACQLTRRLGRYGAVRWATCTPLTEGSTWAAPLDVRRLRWNAFLASTFTGVIDWEGQLRLNGSPWLNPAWCIPTVPGHPNAIGQQRLADFLLAEW